MVNVVRKENKEYFQCKECGFCYTDDSTHSTKPQAFGSEVFDREAQTESAQARRGGEHVESTSLITGKEWAEKCEAWCRKHKSCNIEIIKHAVEPENLP